MSSEKIITVGKLGRSRGVHGEIYVNMITDFPERFEGLKEIFIKRKNGWELIKIEVTDFISGRPVIKFEGIKRPEEVARLTNRLLGVLKKDIVALPENTFYVYDIVNCEVIGEHDNKRIGVIIEVERYPASDIYLVRTDKGKMQSIPVVKQFIKKIDLENRKVIIDIAGLIDLK